MPITICVVSNCNNEGIHSFPTDEFRKRRWLNVLNWPSNSLTYDAKICSKHFLDSDYSTEGFLLENRVLKKYAVPSVFPASVERNKNCVESSNNHEINTKKIQHILSNHQATKKTVHEDVICNNCKEEIKGYRYKCVQCPDYDLCSACEISRIHSEHVVIRLPKPLPYKLLQDVLTPLRSIFIMKKDDGNTSGKMEIFKNNQQFNRNTSMKQKFEDESEDYPIEYLEDSFDSSEWEPTASLESSAQPALKVKSMEIFKVVPKSNLSQDNNLNFKLGQVPLKIYGSKVKSQIMNESANDGDQRNDQVSNNEVYQNLQNNYFKVDMMDQSVEILEEEYLEEE